MGESECQNLKSTVKLALFTMLHLFFSTPIVNASDLSIQITENQSCPFGYYQEGLSCLKTVKVLGGKWFADNLRCENGYVRVQEKDGQQHCYQLHEITNGKYEGPRISCARGFVPVNWNCTPRSMVRDRSLIMDIENFCPEGYQESGDGCVPKPVQKTLLVRKAKLQGISLSMSEEEAFNTLLAKGYEHFEDPSLPQETRGFEKKEIDGSHREIYLDTKGQPLAVFEILYKQAFPNANFNYQKVRQSVLEHFGSPDKVSDYRERDMFIYQDEPSKRSPTLTISFPGNQIVMHMVWRNLEDWLIDQKRQAEKGISELRQSSKPDPVIKF